MALLVVLAAIVLGMGDNGRVVTVPASAQVLVTLPSNPSTGFGWRLRLGSGLDRIAVVSHRYTPPAHPLPGRGGSETWRLRGPAAGRATVELVYVRSWQPQRVARRFRVVLRVR